MYTFETLTLRNQPGVVAHACNPATWRLGLVDDVKAGIMGAVGLCRSGVHVKLSVNMVYLGELEPTRLCNEERIGRGWKHSRQKFPRPTAAGSHLRIGCRQHPVHKGQTQFFSDFEFSTRNFYIIFLGFRIYQKKGRHFKNFQT